MARPVENIFGIKREKVRHIRVHAGVQVGNKVFQSIDEKTHKAEMWTRYDGVEIKMNGERVVVPVGNIYVYWLHPEDAQGE